MMITMFTSLWRPVASEEPYFFTAQTTSTGAGLPGWKTLLCTHAPLSASPRCPPFQLPDIPQLQGYFLVSWPRNLRTTWTLSSICSLPLVCHQILSLLDWNSLLSCCGSSFCHLILLKDPLGHTHLPSEIPSTVSVQANVPKIVLASRHFFAEYFVMVPNCPLDQSANPIMGFQTLL